MNLEDILAVERQNREDFLELMETLGEREEEARRSLLETIYGTEEDC